MVKIADVPVFHIALRDKRWLWERFGKYKFLKASGTSGLVCGECGCSFSPTHPTTQYFPRHERYSATDVNLFSFLRKVQTPPI